MLLLWSGVGALEFFFILTDHELSYIIACFVVDGMRDVAEFARAQAFIGHGDKQPSLCFYHAQVVDDKATVYSDGRCGLELARFFHEAESYQPERAYRSN